MSTLFPCTTLIRSGLAVRSSAASPRRGKAAGEIEEACHSRALDSALHSFLSQISCRSTRRGIPVAVPCAVKTDQRKTKRLKRNHSVRACQRHPRQPHLRDAATSKRKRYQD